MKDFMNLMKLRFVLFIFFGGVVINAFAQDQFIPTTKLNVARAGPTATLMQDGRVLAAGGQTNWSDWCITGSNSAEVYDPATAAWSIVPNSLSFDRVAHNALLLNDGRVWIAGTYEN